MTVTTNYLVTGNGITGSTANAVQALVSRAGIQTAKRAVVIGDSIMGLGATIEDYDPTILSTAVGQYSLRAKGFPNALNVLLGMPFDVVYWGGITGQVVREIAAREATVFNRVFDIVIENGGTNDVSLFATEHGGSLAVCEDAVVASRIARWQTAIGKGAALVIALDCLPVGSSSAYTAAQKYCLLRINARLAAAAQSYPAVRWVDGTAALVDPSSATGLVRASTLADNDRHPGAYGAWLLAKQAMNDSAITALRAQRPVLSSALDCYQADTSSKNLLNTATGLVTGSTGAASGTGMSGTVITKLTGSRQIGSGASIVASVVAAPNGIGNAQRFAITGAALGDTVRALILPAITVTEFPQGAWGYFEAMVKVAGGVGLQPPTISAGVQYAGGSLGGALTSSFMSFGGAGEPGGSVADEVLFMRSPPVYFPADATSLTFIKGEIFFTFGAGSGAVTADMYCMRWVKL